MSNFYNVSSAEELQNLLSQDLKRVSLLSFWAPLEGNPCEKSNELVLALSKTYGSVLVLSIQAEEQEDISDSFEIESVPTFLILQGHTLLERIVGADSEKLTTLLAKHARRPTEALSKTDQAPAAAPSLNGAPTSAEPPKQEETTEELNERLHKLMTQSKVVAFIKGSPDTPRCGFSRQVVALLREQNVEFTHFDILTDESVRQGLKVLNDWPTFPQIIVNGELVGGLDIVKEMVANDEFDEAFKGE